MVRDGEDEDADEKNEIIKKYFFSVHIILFVNYITYTQCQAYQYQECDGEEQVKYWE